jgi:predicted nucleic acid-binding Zn ribbon protein
VTGRRKRPHPDAKPTKPERLNLALTDFLKTKGLRDRVIQANAIDDWPNVVGPQISKVTEALKITPDGTLFVAVTTNAWMNELSLMEPELIRVLNIHASARRVKKIRFELKR